MKLKRIRLQFNLNKHSVKLDMKDNQYLLGFSFN